MYSADDLIEKPMNDMTPQGYSYITEVTFASACLGINPCYSELEKRGYTKVQGDIRAGGGKKFVALGYKKENKKPITDIKGVISDSKEDIELIEGEIIYEMIQDGELNGDINKGSGGKYLYLYSTTDPAAGKPIKDLIFASYSTEITTEKDLVKNASKSLRKGYLDINSYRAPAYNYIFLVR